MDHRYWWSLQTNTGVILLVVLAAWTLINLVLGSFFLIPFPDGQGGNEHLLFDSFNGSDHNRNQSLAAAFFFSVQTLSSVGYGFVNFVFVVDTHAR